MIQGGQGDCQGGLQPDHAAGRPGEGPGLLLGGVGGVVGGDGVDGAVPQAGDDPLHILLCPQGGIDPGQGPLRQDLVLCEGKILGAGLAGNGHPVLLHPAHDVHRLCRRDMADVDPGAGLLRQHGRAHHLQLLSDGGPSLQPELAGYAALVHRPALHHGGVLTVAEDRQLLPLGPYHGVPHQVGVVHVAAVIGEGHRPRLFQRLCVGGLLPSQPHGHRRDGVDVDAAPLLGPLQQRPPDPPGPGGTPDEEPRQIVAGQSRKALEPLPVLIDEHLGGGQRRPHLLHMVAPIALRKKAVGFQVGVQPDLHHLVQILRTESPDHNAAPPLTAR